MTDLKDKPEVLLMGRSGEYPRTKSIKEVLDDCRMEIHEKHAKIYRVTYAGELVDIEFLEKDIKDDLFCDDMYIIDIYVYTKSYMYRIYPSSWWCWKVEPSYIKWKNADRCLLY
jgi:hypothetical protein